MIGVQSARFMAVAHYRHGKEGLIWFSYDESSIRRKVADVQERYIKNADFLGFSIRYWVPLTQGGYWKTLQNWNPRHKGGAYASDAEDMVAAA